MPNDDSVTARELQVALDNVVKVVEAQSAQIAVLMSMVGEDRTSHALLASRVGDMAKTLARIETMVIIGNGQEPLKETARKALSRAGENSKAIRGVDNRVTAQERLREDNRNKLILGVLVLIGTAITAITALFK